MTNNQILYKSPEPPKNGVIEISQNYDSGNFWYSIKVNGVIFRRIPISNSTRYENAKIHVKTWETEIWGEIKNIKFDTSPVAIIDQRVELEPIRLPEILTTDVPTWRLSFDLKIFETNAENETIDAVF